MYRAEDLCEKLECTYSSFIYMSVDFPSLKKESLKLSEVVSDLAKKHKESLPNGYESEIMDDDMLVELYENGVIENIGKMISNFLEERSPGTTRGHVGPDIVNVAGFNILSALADEQNETSRYGLPEAVVKQLPARLGLISKTLLKKLKDLQN